MSRYFYLHVVRRLRDPNTDNFFLSNAPCNSGVHSSFMDLLFDRTAQIDPALYPKPDWYRDAFFANSKPISVENFFEPASAARDLEHTLAEIMERNARLPVRYRLRVGNKAGAAEILPGVSVPVYYENEPCELTTDEFGVHIWARKSKGAGYHRSKQFRLPAADKDDRSVERRKEFSR
jgi:hypothetical protein